LDRVERAERGGPGEFDWLENMSAEELRAFINDALKDEELADMRPPSDSAN
jgi:hypothetical protein